MSFEEEKFWAVRQHSWDRLTEIDEIWILLEREDGVDAWVWWQKFLIAQTVQPTTGHWILAVTSSSAAVDRSGRKIIS